MKLKSGIKKAVALLPKDKATAFYKVRFVAKPSSVFVTDGLCSTIVLIDDKIPDFLCDASVLVKAVKDKGDLAFEIEGGGKVCLVSDVNRYTLQGEDINTFPLPIYPDESMFQEADLLQLNNLIYGASKNSKNGGLPYINFTNNFIEATDRTRLIKLIGTFPWIGLLSIDLFNKWPKKCGVTAFYFDNYRVFFKLGDEYRYSFNVKEEYPDTAIATDIPNTASICVMDRKVLLDTVKQATDVSEIKGVSIEFGSNPSVIRALGRGSVMDTYSGSIDVDKVSTISKTNIVSVNGKLLSQSLRNLKTDFVTCVYDKYPAPLILRGDQVFIYIWPMLNE